MYALKTPKVAILADEPVGPTSYGLVRFLLEHECGLNAVPVSLENLDDRRPRHDQINVLILPDGQASHYKKAFADAQLDDLRDWVSRGGVLVCIGGASEFAADPDTKLTSSRADRQLRTSPRHLIRQTSAGAATKDPHDSLPRKRNRRIANRSRFPVRLFEPKLIETIF